MGVFCLWLVCIVMRGKMWTLGIFSREMLLLEGIFAILSENSSFTWICLPFSYKVCGSFFKVPIKNIQ